MATNTRFAVAVHVLTVLAWTGDEPVKSDGLATSVNTNPVVIRRIICALGRAGLVTSQSGAGGGSRLARSPGQITLLEVHRAIEGGGIFSLHRQPPSMSCPVGMHIETVLEDVFGEAHAAVERVLAKITIEQVLQKVGPCMTAGRRKVQKAQAAR
jgi:Rrf2 family protein